MENWYRIILKLIFFFLAILLIYTIDSYGFSLDVNVYNKNNYQENINLDVSNQSNSFISNTVLLKRYTSSSNITYFPYIGDLLPWKSIQYQPSLISNLEDQNYSLQGYFNVISTGSQCPSINFGIQYNKEFNLNPYISIEDLSPEINLPYGYTLETPSFGISIPIRYSNSSFNFVYETVKINGPTKQIYMDTYGISYSQKIDNKLNLLLTYINSKHGSYVFNNQVNYSVNKFVNWDSDAIYYTVNLMYYIANRTIISIGYQNLNSNLNMRTYYANIQYLLNDQSNIGIEYDSVRIDNTTYPNMFLQINLNF